jgi:hypothetical protein
MQERERALIHENEKECLEKEILLTRIIPFLRSGDEMISLPLIVT